MIKTEEEWKKKLTGKQFDVLRKKATEIPFTGKLLYNKDTGNYRCAGCGADLFSSTKKFDSGTGWPSFYDANMKNIELNEEDDGRIEVICKKCGGHLGHVFDDGPKPTGKRFCINSCALEFSPK